jgi:nitrogen fixation protein FixH
MSTLAGTVAMRQRRSLIPWLFVAAMGLVVAVNGVMITLAVRTFTGLAVSDPYEEGLAYNRVLEAQTRQDQLGWRLALRQEAGGVLTLAAQDAEGRPLEGLQVQARLVRPVEPLPDMPLSFAPASDGRYRATLPAPRAGQWDVQLDAHRAADRFHLKQRIFVP